MLQEAMHMSSSHLADEMREAEEELEEDTSLHDPSNPHGSSMPLEHLEEGRSPRGPLENSLAARTSSPASHSRSASPRPSPRNSRPSISLAAGVGPQKAADALTRFRESTRNVIQMLTSPVFAQAFILTFLGEWGDRSQITTIAMAGAHVRTQRLLFGEFWQLTTVHPRCRIRHHRRTLALHIYRRHGRAISLDQAVDQAQ